MSERAKSAFYHKNMLLAKNKLTQNKSNSKMKRNIPLSPCYFLLFLFHEIDWFHIFMIELEQA